MSTIYEYKGINCVNIYLAENGLQYEKLHNSMMWILVCLGKMKARFRKASELK